jgi:hypothetical protein
MVKAFVLSVKILFLLSFLAVTYASRKTAGKAQKQWKSKLAALYIFFNLYSPILFFATMFCYFKTFFSRIAGQTFFNQL